MTKDTQTAHLGLPLPDMSHKLQEDCPRLVTAFNGIDTHAQQTDAALQAHDERITQNTETLEGHTWRIEDIEDTTAGNSLDITALEDVTDKHKGRLEIIEKNIPNPKAADGSKFLRGNGTWFDVVSHVVASCPAWYRRDKMPSVTKDTVTIHKDTQININSVGYIVNADVTVNTSSVGAKAALAGKDVYIYACAPASGGALTFNLSLNSTVPDGYTADTSRKIGGFHCLCVNAGTNISDNNNIHPLSGYVAGDILPCSVWDLRHRPKSDPEGMVYVEGLDLWVDIYLASYSGSYAADNLRLESKFGAVCADGTSAEKFHCYKFEQVFAKQKKRLLYQREFIACSIGSNQSTNVQGSADVNTTGGFKDTAGRRMISNFGIEDCCGNLWQWGADVGYGATGSNSWGNAFDANDRYVGGQWYGGCYRPFFGGGADHGAICGSRASAWNNGALVLYWYLGARGASEPLAV